MKKSFYQLFYRIRFPALFIYILLAVNYQMHSQSLCMPTVPSYTINLTGQPAGVWSSPNISREDQCCAASSSDECVFFNLTLDPRAAGIQIDMIGADPPGSLFYDINCTGSYPGGTIKCIAGVGPHLITFCKPGKNKNVYKITSISKPIFPPDDTVRIGCMKRLNTLGIVNNTTVWQSIYPGAPGAYDNYLDSTHIASPLYTPQTGAPAYIDYKVCGFPIASGCGFNFTVCDTVRIYNYPVLNVSASPNPASFCNVGSGSGLTLNASSSGGLPTYNYYWYNSSNVLIGTGQTYFASAAGNYKLESRDRLYAPSYCPSVFTTVSVTQGSLPVVDAGPNQKLCASSPVATLNGTLQYASGSIWSGGGGTFSPGNTYLNTSYTPTPTEISNGYVKLYLTSTGSGGGCNNRKDSVIIYYSPLFSVDISGNSLLCNNSTSILTANITGGTTPFFYQWNTGSTNNSISVGEGTYSVIVLDSIGCKATDVLSLNAPSPLNINFNTINANPDGSSTGSATVNIGGGSTPYSITWNPTGLNTATIINLPYGIYTASIIDANGCMISGSTVVNEPRCFNFSASVINTNLNCTGDQNASASVTAVGGTPPYLYQWNTTPAQTNDTVFNLGAGVYSVIVSDANLCYQTASAVINEPDLLTTSITHSDVTTVGGNNGSSTVFAFGGTSPYSYLWSNSSTSNTISGLIAGTYTVRVNDLKGCIKRDSVIITQPPCNDFNVNVITSNVSCFGGSNGSAMSIIGGVGGSYSIHWSNGSSGTSISNLIAGNYSVSISDSKNCTIFYNFTILQPPKLAVSLSPTNISCYGKNNGTIELTVNGGTFPYSFSWSNTSTSEDLIDLSPGTYSVQINDLNGCSANASATIIEPTAIAVTYTTQNVSCIYGTNGSINLSVSGGRNPYVFNWSNGATTEDLSNLTAGGYSVTIKDANNCSIKQPLIIAVSQPDSIKVDSFIVACSVPGTGKTQVNVIPTGGFSGTYQVSINNGPYGSPGNYTFLLDNNNSYIVQLKDLNNCTSLKPDTLVLPSEVMIDSVSFAKCFSPGTNQTLVQVYPSGGSGFPYSVSYNNGSTYLTQGVYSNNLNIANSYSIIIKDNRGCVSAVKTIQIPAVLSASVSITSNYNGEDISCFGVSDGIAQASGSGGTGIYTYSWSTQPIQTSSTANQLSAGTYTVTVKDENNCQATATVTLQQPDQLTASAIVTSDYNGTDISCFGYQDGSAEVTANGGTGSYSYTWYTNPIQTTDSVTGLGAGTYSVIVKDENNCSATSNVTLSQPATITAILSVTSNYNGQHISCYGEHDANLMVVANNGVAPFTYEWSSNSIVLGNTLSGVGAGTYSVTVKDANECAIIKSIQVTQPLQLIATANVISDFNGYDISCFGANDAIASASATGGTGVYTYQWLTIPPQLNDTAFQLSAGSFTVSVRDINECLATATVSVQQPLGVNVNAQVTSNYNGEDISCFGVNDGIAQASASGGTGVFTYSWSTQPVQTTSTANQLSAGTYTVTVKDENNCQATATVTLQQPDQLTASAIVTSDYNGTDISCFGFQDGSAEVTANGGTGSYYYTWNTIPIQSTDSVSGLGAGTYSVIVLDLNKCSTTASVTLEQPAAITATLTVTSNYNGQHISCYGEHDASLIVVANNGVAPYTYEWSSNSVIIGNTLSGGGAGTYSVIVTDANECSIIKSTQVTQPEQLIATSTVISDFNGFDISCFGANNGMASASANGGTGVYTFQWTTNPVQQNSTAVNLTAGTYQVVVTDANQCESTTSIALQQPDQIMISLLDISDYNNFNISCFGSNDGYIDISVQGGVTTYQYNWSNGSTNQDLTELIAGNYMVTVTDANNCTSQLNVELNQPEQLMIQVDSISNYNGFNVSCNGSDDGFIAVTVFGGVTSYNFVWSNNTSSEDLYNIGSGTYNLLITDANKCSQSISLLLNEPTEVISSSIKQEPLCYGLNTGSIDVSINGGVANYTYNWSNGPQTEDIDNLVAGNYTLTYHDQNNCSGSLSVTINQPDPLLITKNVEPIACYGDSLGNILTEVDGGVAPYQYTWSNQLSGNNLLNMPAGVYMLLVKDANNCSVADTTVLIQPDSLQATIQSSLYFNGHHVSLNNAYDGSINLTVTGGVGNYNYLWSNGETSEDIAQLHAGTYYVTVIDSNGCRVSTSIVLTEPFVLEMPEGFSPNDDGKNDYFIIHGIESYPQNNLKIFNRWGNIVYQKDGYINTWHGENTDGQELPDATYFAILEINNGDIVLKGYVEIRKK